MNDPVLQGLRKIMDGEDVLVKRNTILVTLVSKIDELSINKNDIIYRENNEGISQVVLPPFLHETVFELLLEQPCARHLGTKKTKG